MRAMKTELILLELMLVLIAQTTTLAFGEPQATYNSELGPTSLNSHAKVQAGTSADIPQSILNGNGCVAKAGEYMGGCLGWQTYADSGCACFAECHVYNICCDDIDWIKCSCQNVRDAYHKDESICKYQGAIPIPAGFQGCAAQVQAQQGQDPTPFPMSHNIP